MGLFTGGSRSNKEKERLHSINVDYNDDDDDDSHDSSAYSEFAISKRENTPRSTNNRKNTSSLPLEKDDLIESSFEILSQDELFKLTSNELRRRCTMFQD